MQGSGYNQRDKTRWKTLYWLVREIIQRTLAIIPWHSFAASNSEGTNYFFSRPFSVLFNFSPVNKYLFWIWFRPTAWPVLKFRDVVRKWHHNSDNTTDTRLIIYYILSVLYFNLISSCVIHHLLWHLVFAVSLNGLNGKSSSRSILQKIFYFILCFMISYSEYFFVTQIVI